MLNRILIAAFIALGFSGAAQAGQVCNETSFMVEAAKAWRTPTGLAVEGWARIAPGGCAEIGPSTSSDQYLYARTTRAYLGGVREWRGSLDICVDETDFAFEGVADCETLGLETRKFRQLTDAERDHAVLVEVVAVLGARTAVITGTCNAHGRIGCEWIGITPDLIGCDR